MPTSPTGLLPCTLDAARSCCLRLALAPASADSRALERVAGSSTPSHLQRVAGSSTPSHLQGATASAALMQRYARMPDAEQSSLLAVLLSSVAVALTTKRPVASVRAWLSSFEWPKALQPIAHVPLPSNCINPEPLTAGHLLWSEMLGLAKHHHAAVRAVPPALRSWMCLPPSPPLCVCLPLRCVGGRLPLTGVCACLPLASRCASRRSPPCGALRSTTRPPAGFS
jgi:hypothetical protein